MIKSPDGPEKKKNILDRNFVRHCMLSDIGSHRNKLLFTRSTNVGAFQSNDESRVLM